MAVGARHQWRPVVGTWCRPACSGTAALGRCRRRRRHEPLLAPDAARCRSRFPSPSERCTGVA
eukprot:7379017-Prymnesium_polylepis.1